ncbi:hypothetical protein ABK046_46485, partial [Streptomyces caeruleatus]
MSVEGVQALVRMVSCAIVTLAKAVQVPGNTAGSQAAAAGLALISEAANEIPTDPSICDLLKTDLENDRANTAKAQLSKIDFSQFT